MKTFPLSLVALLATLLATNLLAADAPGDLTSRLNTAAQRATGQKYKLAYKFAKGDELRYQVTHLVTVDTTIEGTNQKARTRSVSTKVWKVSDVTKEGHIKFVHMVSDVDMWQKVDRRAEVRYNSRTDEKAPALYANVAKTVGVPLVTATISPAGTVIDRVDQQDGHTWGGQLIAPLPEGEVQVGDKWHSPMEITVRLADGRIQRVKTRQQYQLQSVEDGIAKIAMTTQVLTPINDPKIKVQLVQRLTAGELRFDIAAGRIKEQDLYLDQTVIGFNGASSIMNYLGKFTEVLLPGEGEQTAWRQ